MNDYIKEHTEKIRNTWFLIEEQLWFRPLFICLVILMALGGLTYFEYHYPVIDDLKKEVFNTRLNNAKDIANALLGSMVSMTAMVISITIVVISLASSQMGPRLIKAFISNPKTQTYFGLFFGSVVCAFYFVRITHSQTFVGETLPTLTIGACVLYCFATLFILLFYVNHVAQSAMADTIVRNVGTNLINNIKRIIKSQPYLQDAENKRTKNDGSVPKKYKYKVATISCHHEGYLQYLNFTSLASLLKEADAFLDFKVMVGEHVLKGQKLATVHTKKKKDGDSEEISELVSGLNNYIDVGDNRTQIQDLDYNIRHLVEIGLRALSPGINDPYTAYKVIDQLSASLSLLLSENYNEDFVIDKDDEPRIGGNALSLEQLFSSSLDQIREAACERLDINVYLLDKFQHLAEFATNKKQWNVLEAQLSGIKECENLMKIKTNKDILANKIKETQKVYKDYKDKK